MATSVPLPALGESVTEGTVTRWLKNVGDTVAVDEVHPDAWIAAKGLMSEYAQLKPDANGIPVFRGPDAWYEDTPETRTPIE